MTHDTQKPDDCPFCGGEARIFHGGLAFMASVECTRCGASIKAIDENDPVGITVQKWNTRTGNKALAGDCGIHQKYPGPERGRYSEKDAADALDIQSVCK